MAGGGFIYSFLEKGINTFYKENTFYNKKKFSHFIFYDIYYFNKKKFYKNIFEKRQVNIDKNYNKYSNINRNYQNNRYSNVNKNYKIYEKIFYKIFKEYRKEIFDYKQNLINKKYYREENFLRKKDTNTDYIYNYNDNFKGYYEKIFFKNVYKKIYKDKYIKSLIEENSYTKLNGYKYFYKKKANRIFLYENIKRQKTNLKNEKIKEYENIIKELKNFQERTITELKEEKIDLDEIYEKIKEKIFDEIFMMSGGLY